MTGICFFAYIAFSFGFVFGENRVSNNEKDQRYLGRKQDSITYQECHSKSELQQERSENIKNPFFTPKRIMIGVTILAVPTLGYTVYNRKKQDSTLDKSESTDETDRKYFWNGKTIEQEEILTLQKGWPGQGGYYAGMDVRKDEEMKWVSDKRNYLKFAYPTSQAHRLEVEKLDSRIWTKQVGDIYSPLVYKKSSWLLTGARRFGLPAYRLDTAYDEKHAVAMEYTFYIGQEQEYLDKLKEVYGPRFQNIKSKKIDDMIDELLDSEDAISVGKIKTNLPKGFALQVKIDKCDKDSMLSLIVCAHESDPNTGETIVSLLYRSDPGISEIGNPVNITTRIQKDIIKPTTKVLAWIALNTLPEKQPQVDQSAEIEKSVTESALENTTLPIQKDQVDGSSLVNST